MEFRKYFSFYSEPIPVEDVELLTENILDDLYASSSEVDQLNIFFHLQNEYFFLNNLVLFIYSFDTSTFGRTCIRIHQRGCKFGTN